VHSLDGVSGLDGFPDIFRVFEVDGKIVPFRTQGADDHRVLLAPRGVQFVESGLHRVLGGDQLRSAIKAFRFSRA